MVSKLLKKTLALSAIIISVILLSGTLGFSFSNPDVFASGQGKGNDGDKGKTGHGQQGCETATKASEGKTKNPHCDEPPQCESNADCSDGDVCNGAEACQEGVCTAGEPARRGTPCEGADTCNPRPSCDGAGICDAGPTLFCEDRNVCTSDSCDPNKEGGCVFTPVKDGLNCQVNNVPGTCQGGDCVTVEPPSEQGNIISCICEPNLPLVPLLCVPNCNAESAFDTCRQFCASFKLDIGEAACIPKTCIP